MAKQSKNKRSLKKGGSSCNGAAAYAEQVYGGINAQHAVSETNHTIAMNTVKGGKKKSSNVFTNMKSATMRLLRKARKSSARRSRRMRRSRRRC